MTTEIKTLLLAQALNEISDGTYPTVSSHGDYHIELKTEVKDRYERLIDAYNYANEMLKFVNTECQLT